MPGKKEGLSSTVPEYLRDLIKNPPGNWSVPEVQAVCVLFEQSGILPEMAKRNQELLNRIIRFLLGSENILIIGGESGMGKSLITGELRKLYHDFIKLSSQKPELLSVISWDRTHMAFFEEASTEAGQTIPLPSGETHTRGRQLVSSILSDQIFFVKKYLGKNTRIILEAPLIDSRGEMIYQDLGVYKNEIQTFIMHSPNSRVQTLQEGRLMATSGQKDAMNQIREKLLFNILGYMPVNLVREEQDTLIKHWWQTKIEEWNGMIVEWNPDDNPAGFQNSVEEYKQLGIKPDVLTPRSLSRYTRNHIESVFYTITDLDDLLRLLGA